MNLHMHHKPVSGHTRKGIAGMLITLLTAACQVTPHDIPANASIRPALQAHAWQCDDGTRIQSRNRPAAIELRIGADLRMLPQTPAASGVRYQTPEMTFWNKGGGSTLERRPGTTTACSEIRAASLLEDARIRGVAFRGLGNEPGWLLEIGPDSRVLFEDRYGSARMIFTDVKPQAGTTGATTIYEGRSGKDGLRAVLQPRTCADTMSDETFPATVELEINGERRVGCGTPLH